MSDASLAEIFENLEVLVSGLEYLTFRSVATMQNVQTLRSLMQLKNQVKIVELQMSCTSS